MLFLQVQADVAGGVAGVQIARSRLSGEGEQLGGDDLPVGDGGVQAGQGPHAAARAGGAERGEVLLGGSGGRELLAHVVEPDARFGGPGPYDDLGVGGVHGDPGSGRGADLAGQAVVVGVVVGDDDAVDVGDGDAERGEAAWARVSQDSGSSQPVSTRTGPRSVSRTWTRVCPRGLSGMGTLIAHTPPPWSVTCGVSCGVSCDMRPPAPDCSRTERELVSVVAQVDHLQAFLTSRWIFRAVLSRPWTPLTRTGISSGTPSRRRHQP